MKQMAKGAAAGFQTETLQLRFLSLQSYYDKLRDTKEEIPEWVLVDIFACKHEIERRGLLAPEFKKQKIETFEEPEWLVKHKAERAAMRKSQPF